MRSVVAMFLASFAALAFALSTSFALAHGTVVASFPSASGVYSSLTPDGSRMFYGTAVYLGGNGGIYRLKRKGGHWNYQTLYYFGGSEGANPYSGLMRNPKTGELYGVTQGGGADGQGTVFAFRPSGDGGSLSVLHSFTGEDGALPSSDLLLDEKTGTLYGAAEYGGQHDCGTVFSLTPSGGQWIFTTLYDFRSTVDGCFPLTRLQFGTSSETLIGATDYGFYGEGTIFQLTNIKGRWTKSTLHNMDPSKDGSEPADIAVASDGTVYGIAEKNGERYGAVVFTLSPQRGKWKYWIIKNLGAEGGKPSGLYLDKNSGTLFGASESGGFNNNGLLFKLIPMGHSWNEAVLGKFKNAGRDGKHPKSRPVFDPETGTLYVTTVQGGTNDGGTVYSVQ